jgi:hypothetical protein
MPPGAVAYTISVYRDMRRETLTSFAGPCSGEEAVPDQEYLIPLFDDEGCGYGYEDQCAEEGDRFFFFVEFYDELGEPGEPAGNIVAEQVFDSGPCC